MFSLLVPFASAESATSSTTTTHELAPAPAQARPQHESGPASRSSMAPAATALTPQLPFGDSEDALYDIGLWLSDLRDRYAAADARQPCSSAAPSILQSISGMFFSHAH